MYPSSLIGGLLDTHKCNSQRQRSFSATAAVYYCMALSLYPEAAYGDVFDAVAQGLAWRCVSSRGRTNPRMVKRRNSPMAPLFTEIDALSEAADEREVGKALELLGALYDYAEMLAPEH